jgi:hypothetical protein
MKKILLFVLLSFLFSGMYAQGDGVAPLAKGEKQLNFGLGFSNHGLPIYGSFDIALHKDVTITPEVHLWIPFPGNSFGGGAMCKADYHWNYLIGIPSNWDFYAGARVGFSFSDQFYPEFGIQVGGRWYWDEKWGLNVELAGGTGFGTTFGLSMKL